MGRITAHITCGDDGAPARFVQVILVPARDTTGAEAPLKRLESTTDRYGDATFSNVATGTYFVDASLVGYLRPLHLVSETALQSKDPAMRKVVLDQIPHVALESNTSAQVAVALQRGAVVSGRLAYDDGVPIESISVRVIRVKDAGSDQADDRSVMYKKNFEVDGVTDDRGVYRVAGLPAGTYIASARIMVNHLQLYAGTKGSLTMSVTQPGDINLTFYAPATTQRTKAQEFNVADGDERRGIDLTADLTHLHSLGGFVQRQGLTLAGASVGLKSVDDPEDTHATLTDETGFFRFDLIPEGAYKLTVYPPLGGAREAEGERKPAVSQPVTVTNTDALNLSIDIQKVSSASQAVQ